MTRTSRNIIAALSGLIVSTLAVGQVSPKDHAKHHPGGPTVAGQPGGIPSSTVGMGAGAPGGGGMAGGMGGMMEGIGEMMKGMGGTPPKAFYPSLMDLPDLAPEKRDEVLRAAHERMKSGADLMAAGLDELVKAAPTNNYAVMQAATAKLREGVARFDSGLAANRAIAEGRDPRALAMQWFKAEMNLRTTTLGAEPSGPLGLTWSHLFIMVLLVGFAAVMIAMYFFKMRRAAALFGRIEAGKGRPPPGSAPPLAGSPGPSVPGGKTGGQTPPTEEKDAPAAGKPSTPDVKAPPAEVKGPVVERQGPPSEPTPAATSTSGTINPATEAA